jgi:hypothetical protein
MIGFTNPVRSPGYRIGPVFINTMSSIFLKGRTVLAIKKAEQFNGKVMLNHIQVNDSSTYFLSPSSNGYIRAHTGIFTLDQRWSKRSHHFSKKAIM